MSGEHPNGRKAMEDVQRRLREMGVPDKQAEEKAREVARREDKKRNA
jgi:hypothetical protein